MDHNHKVVGVFDTEHEAVSAIEDLKMEGLAAEEISVLAHNKNDFDYVAEETGTKAPEGLAVGATTGGMLGGVTGLLVGLGALAIPGIGPFLGAGPIAAALTGVVVGAGAGGLVGGLIGLGIPKDEAEQYESFLKEGYILLLVDSLPERNENVYEIFRQHRSLNVNTYGKQPHVPVVREDHLNSNK
jgi:uncharacterized membrane protein